MRDTVVFPNVLYGGSELESDVVRPQVMVLSRSESLGDCFLKLPMIRAIQTAFPGFGITWVVSEGTFFAHAMCPLARQLFDRLINRAAIEHPFSHARQRLAKLPAAEVIVDCRSAVSSVLLARVTLNAPRYITCLPRFAGSKSAAPAGRRPQHWALRWHRQIELAAGRRLPFDYRLTPPPAMRELAARQLPADRPAIALATAASRADKCWPLERYAALANLLVDRGKAAVFLIGPDEHKQLSELRARCPNAYFSGLVDEATKPEMLPWLFLALGERVRAAVTNESGLGHLLSAVDTPLLTLIGPTPSARWKPLSTGAQQLEAASFGPPCMESISVDAAISGLDRLLKVGR